jgi:hypothetical protein
MPAKEFDEKLALLLLDDHEEDLEFAANLVPVPDTQNASSLSSFRVKKTASSSDLLSYSSTYDMMDTPGPEFVV